MSEKEKVYWPSGFTRGVPTEAGTYVLLCRDGGSYALVLEEIHILNKETAERFDLEPGPCIVDSFEEFDYFATANVYNIVGYMKLEGVSAFDLWRHIGELEDEPEGEEE